LRILGIDPGSSICGYGCIEIADSGFQHPKNFRIIEVGTIKPPQKNDFLQRLLIIHQEIDSIMVRLKPEVVAIEKVFAKININSTIKLSEIRGAIFSSVLKHTKQVYSTSPASVKKAITGQGRASKDQVELALKSLMQFDRGNLSQDASDAMAIAVSCGLDVQQTNMKVAR